MQHEDQNMEESVCETSLPESFNFDLGKQRPFGDGQDMALKVEDIKPAMADLRLESGEPSVSIRGNEQINDPIPGYSKAKKRLKKPKIADVDQILREILTRESKSKALSIIKSMSKTRTRLYVPVERLTKGAKRKRRRCAHPQGSPHGGVKKRVRKTALVSNKMPLRRRPVQYCSCSSHTRSMSSASFSSFSLG